MEKIIEDARGWNHGPLYPALVELSRPLCEAMRTKLPLELRNMVYLHLCLSAHVRMDPWDSQLVRKHTPVEPCGHPPPPFEAEYTQVPPWWRVDFVGQEFLGEVVLQWYYTSTFVVNRFNTDELRRLFIENPFTAKKTPPRELINNHIVRVQIDLRSEIKLTDIKEHLKRSWT